MSRWISEWCKKSIADASQALESGSVSSVELTQSCIDQIIATRSFNMFVYTDFERSLRLAEESDSRRLHNKSRGVLDGIPFGVKDNFCMQNVPTTACSKMLKDFISPYESTATQRLLDNGAIPMGKLNMDEFGMGSGTLYSEFGATINPWSTDLENNAVVAGGSSGGSSAAEASGCCFVALGSDTGGSVRQPAAFCGVVGLKPSYGRVSRHGLISYASSLDTPGVLARTVNDAMTVLKAIEGPDGLDSTAIQDVDQDYMTTGNATSILDGFSIGIPSEYYISELSAKSIAIWNQGIRWLKQAGATITKVSLPTTKLCLPVYYILACAEASSNLSRYDGIRYGYRAQDAENKVDRHIESLRDLYCRNRTEGFGSEVQRRILLGTFVLSQSASHEYYERATLLRQQICDDFTKVFKEGKLDVLLTPTTPSGPFSLSHHKRSSEPLDMYLRDIMTVSANLARLPAISVPVAVTEGPQELPLALQLMAPYRDERRLQAVANALEKAAQFDRQIPDRVFSTVR